MDIIHKYTIGDGLSIVIDFERSQGSWLCDALTGNMYLDCYSQFASQPVGWNHYRLNKNWLGLAKNVKIANSDIYTEEYVEFVKDFVGITLDFSNYFFIDTGTLAVENALKASFDWKAQKLGLSDVDEVDFDVIHLKEAFHGRSGYTLSLTNTTPVKTKWFPKFKWTRIINPKEQSAEADSLEQAEQALRKGLVAAIILEPIQGEGGDNHFRPEYFRALRVLADKYEAMLIFDEVQTGVGLTGKMWAYEHFNVIPDMLTFGKKTQVCGFCSTNKINEVSSVFKVSGRINSTWGGNLVDMIRFSVLKKIIQDENLVENAKKVGKHLLDNLKTIKTIENARGLGLMIAFDLEKTQRRDEVVKKLSEKMLVLKCGQKSVRLRPHLTFSEKEADLAAEFIIQATTIHNQLS